MKKDCTSCGYLNSNTTSVGNGKDTRDSFCWYCAKDRDEFKKAPEIKNQEHFFDACYEPK